MQSKKQSVKKTAKPVNKTTKPVKKTTDEPKVDPVGQKLACLTEYHNEIVTLKKALQKHCETTDSIEMMGIARYLEKASERLNEKLNGLS